MANKIVTFTTYKTDGSTPSGTPFVFGFVDKAGNNNFDNTGTALDADLEIPPPPPPGDGAGNPISTSYIDSMYVKVNDGTNDINAYQYFIDSSDNSDIALNLAVRDYTADDVVFKYDVNDVSGVLGTLNITNGDWIINLVDSSVSDTDGSNPSVTENGDVRTVTLPHLGNDLFYTMNLKQYVADSGTMTDTITIVTQGWNMISVPAQATLSTSGSVSNSIYWYNNGYTSYKFDPPSILEPYRGFWIKTFQDNLNITINYQSSFIIPTGTNSITIATQGWNMISIPAQATLSTSGSVSNSIYWYNNGYTSYKFDPPSILEPYRGFWIKTFQDNLVININYV